MKELSPKTVKSLQMTFIGIASVVIYFNTLFNGFVMDDSFQIITNRWIKYVRYIPEIFSSNFVLGGETAFYRPMVHVFYMISYHLFGPEPWGFHLMSIVFHTGTSVLVFLTISRLLRKQADASSSRSPEGGKQTMQWISFAAALLFATHPVHTEAVAWISVTDIYMTFFYLLSFYLYMRSSVEGASSAAAYAFSVVSFFLALLCKEPALTLPVIVVAYDYVYREEGTRIFPYQRYVPYLIAAGVYFVLRFYALGGMTTNKAHMDLSPSQYVIAVLALFKEYIGKLFLPVNLNVWHVFRPPSALFSVPGIISLLVTAGFLIVAVIAIRKSRVALLGFLFIVLPLLPALYLPGLTQGLENAFTERYLYLPSFGFILLVASLASLVSDMKPGWRPALVVSISAVVVLYTVGTVNRIPVWKDGYTLWTDVVKKSPKSATAHNGLAAALMEKGRLDDAISQYLIALRLDPGNHFSHAYLGIAYNTKGWSDKAVEELRTALSLRPGFAEAHNILGVIYENLGRNDAAIREFEIALRLNPELDDVYKHLGIVYSNEGMMEKSIEYFQIALRLDPDDADTHNNAGVAYAQQGMMDKASAHFEAAIAIKPGDPAFHYNLAKAYKMKGLSEKAEKELRTARDWEKSKRSN